MLYVQQSLSPGEDIIHVGRFHWIYSLSAVLNILWGFLGCVAVVGGAVYYAQNYGNAAPAESMIAAIRETHPGIRLGAFLVFIMGLVRFAQMMIHKATTEIAVTTSRLVYKRGLVARYVGEMNVNRIESVNVLQTFWGRIFGYGRIMVRGMGVGEVILPAIAEPITFRKAIEKARTKDENEKT